MQRVPFAATAALALALGLAAGCGREEAPSGAAGARNVVLIVVDTLRADHLGVYGYARDTSPRIDALAERATVFTHAISSSGWTLPSHASLFTGLDPFEHGLHRTAAAGEDNALPLRVDQVTLAQALAEEGFTTAGFAANTYLAPRTGLDRGFETWEVEREAASAKSQRVLAWLYERGDEPFFLFVNFMDTHRPYNTRPRPGLIPRPVDRDPALLDDLKRRVLPRRAPVPQELRTRVIDQYDTAVAHADEAVGELLDGLGVAGLLDDTLVIVTSDHGEYFGEHELVEHGLDVYEPGLRIPLLVKQAGQRQGRRSAERVSSTDVARLVVGGLPPDVGARVSQRLGLDPASRPLLAEQYFAAPADLASRAWGHRFRRVRRALYDGAWKLIVGSDGSRELYDLAADPAEAHDLAAERPAVADALARRLDGWMEARRAGRPEEPVRSPAPVSPEDAAELRALGYAD